MAARNALVDLLVDRLFSRTDSNRLLAVRLRNGHTKVLYRGDMVSGAILAAIVQRAKEKAIDRSLNDLSSITGIGETDLLAAIDDEYREGEVLPQDDAAEEWLDFSGKEYRNRLWVFPRSAEVVRPRSTWWGRLFNGRLIH